MANYSVKLASNQRVAFVGKTGSGKSYLARALLARVPRLLVLDPKGQMKPAEWGLTNWGSRSEAQLKGGDAFRLRVKTPLDGDWERYLWAAYKAANLCVYIDEDYGVALGSDPPPALNALMTRGRELNIGVWHATQRPAWVPLMLLSECEWFFSFRLQLERDRKRMAEMIGPAALASIPDKYGFYVYSQDWDRPVYCPGATVTQREGG